MTIKRSRLLMTTLAVIALGVISAGPTWAQQARASVRIGTPGAWGRPAAPDTSAAASSSTTTPIKHLVVIFDENVSFDHYFATYPQALNPTGEPPFNASPDTPAVNGLPPALLTANPNLDQPVRLSRKQALTCDMNHEYTAEQEAFDHGLMDQFVQFTEGKASNAAQYCPTGIVMDYFDGNTVTALWNYAQHFAMDDNAYNTTFGPSTPGVLDLTTADTTGAVCGPSSAVTTVSPCSATTSPPMTAGAGTVTGTVYSDADPYYDDCSAGGPADKSKTIALTGQNIGDLLSAAGITWGWFQGGFDDCFAKHPDVAYDMVAGINPVTDPNNYTDYNAHHEPFQYYPTTTNPHHLKPTSPAMIGHTDQANHQYDLMDFWAAADAGNLPAVSFLKAPSYEDGHAGYSDPLDEQVFLVNTINHLESLASWPTTAVIINYDDSDGWYDHVMGPIINRSNTSLDVGCGTVTDGAPARCGYGPRLPYLIISPYARENFVDHAVIDQSSTTRFIEDNWLGGQRLSAESFDNKAGSIEAMFDFRSPTALAARCLFLDPTTGEPL